MATAADGTLYVSIPVSGGSVLARLHRHGEPAAGWPILNPGASPCGLLQPVDDGSVRVVCQYPSEQVVEGPPPGRALAFDAGGRPLPGWPVDVPCCFTGRAIGHELTMYVGEVFGTDFAEGEPIPGNDWIVAVAADGTASSGVKVPHGIDWAGSNAWAVGPDGVAYGTIRHYPDAPAAPTSELSAVSLQGVPAGWPILLDDVASGPAFGGDGRVVLSVASSVRPTTRVLVFDQRSGAMAANSAELAVKTSELVVNDGPYECGTPIPPLPLVAQDGTTFVFSEIDTAFVALDASLEVMGGWPYRPATPLVRRDPPSNPDGITCPSLAVPAIGPDNTIYLPLQARDQTVGGSILALGPDGRARPGWPVELRRPGSQFWSVIVGSDGTAYALAIEPESGDSSSASILAVAPDSTVLWTTTIIEP